MTDAGQETLQKALAEKDREVAELNSDLKLLQNDYNHLKTNFDETVEKNKRLKDKVVGLTAEKDRLIKTFGECQAEAIKEFEKEIRAEINEAIRSNQQAKKQRIDRLTEKGIVCNDNFCSYCDGKIHALCGISEFIDNLVKEMAGEE